MARKARAAPAIGGTLKRQRWLRLQQCRGVGIALEENAGFAARGFGREVSQTIQMRPATSSPRADLIARLGADCVACARRTRLSATCPPATSICPPHNGRGCLFSRPPTARRFGAARAGVLKLAAPRLPQLVASYRPARHNQWFNREKSAISNIVAKCDGLRLTRGAWNSHAARELRRAICRDGARRRPQGSPPHAKGSSDNSTWPPAMMLNTIS
jgi:hypothetical protein